MDPRLHVVIFRGKTSFQKPIHCPDSSKGSKYSTCPSNFKYSSCNLYYYRLLIYGKKHLGTSWSRLLPRKKLGRARNMSDGGRTVCTKSEVTFRYIPGSETSVKRCPSADTCQDIYRTIFHDGKNSSFPQAIDRQSRQGFVPL